MGVTTAKRRQNRRRLRYVAVGAGLCLAFYCLFFLSRATGHEGSAVPVEVLRRPDGRLPSHILNSLSLTGKQCTDAFPGLTQSIDDIVAEGPFRVTDRGDLGPLQGRIKDGKASAPPITRKASDGAFLS